MTATALTLRPGFASLTDALAHYGRRAWPASSVVPPVDATGDDLADAFLAAIFGRLATMDSAVSRISLLTEKICTEARHIEALDGLRHDLPAIRAAAEHRRTLAILRRWAGEMAGDSVTPRSDTRGRA